MQLRVNLRIQVSRLFDHSNHLATRLVVIDGSASLVDTEESRSVGGGLALADVGGLRLDNIWERVREVQRRVYAHGALERTCAVAAAAPMMCLFG